jgi:hypothetical protein
MPPLRGSDPEASPQHPRRSLVTLLAALALVLTTLPAAGQGSAPVTDPGTGVISWPDLDRQAAQHVDSTVEYQMVPPAGGPHNPIWQSCGAYSAPIYNEHAVHSLEHGAVWITYDPSLPAADVQRLHEIANQGYIIVSPYPGLTDPVVASSWARQNRLTGVDDPHLQQFIVDFRRNPETAPEPNATCSMGVTDVMPTGELPQQPAANAGTQQQAGATETPAVQGDTRDEYKEKN